jgi:Glycosyltransferase family 28 N-terminal domain
MDFDKQAPRLVSISGAKEQGLDDINKIELHSLRSALRALKMSLQPSELDEIYPVEPKVLLSSAPRRPTIAESEASSTPAPSYRSLALHDSQVDVDAYPTEDGLLVVDVENGASKIVNALAAELFLPGEEAAPEYVSDELSRPVYRPAPPLNVVIQIVGSRGDVQPFVALGQVLKATYGHRVRIATHPTFKKFVEDHGLEFFSITGDPAQMMDFMVKNPGLMPKFKTLREGEIGRRRKAIFEIVEACWRSCIEPSDSSLDIDQDDETTRRPFIADAIIANPPSFAHIHCAEKLGIPLHMMFTYVTIPCPISAASD